MGYCHEEDRKGKAEPNAVKTVQAQAERQLFLCPLRRFHRLERAAPGLQQVQILDLLHELQALSEVK